MQADAAVKLSSEAADKLQACQQFNQHLAQQLCAARGREQQLRGDLEKVSAASPCLQEAVLDGLCCLWQ